MAPPPLPDALALTLYAQRCDLDALGRLVADRADRDAARRPRVPEATAARCRARARLY